MPQILVVDDSKVMRDMIVACLRDIPEANFTAATNGLEAIERLSLGAFQLMVLDLNMPDIGGIEVLEFVRGLEELRGLPVMVVTTRTDEGSRDQALAAGANRFLTKPFTPEALRSEVRALLGGRTMTRVELTEFLDAYLGEVDELLATANAQLLAIDPLQRQGESTARQVRELFRSLHTVKGCRR